MFKIIKELTIFFVFAYMAVWLGFGVLFVLDLRSASAIVSEIEAVFLVELSVVVWFSSLCFLYILRVLFILLAKKLNPEAAEGGP